MLADLGADVLKVEPPGGVAARRLAPFDDASPDRSLYWAAVGLGKRSTVIDLFESSQGPDALRALLRGADVFIESFDPGALASIGLGAVEMMSENPGLVYASVTPFGSDGPRAEAPATELTLEAAGGLLGLQGDGDRPPIPVGMPQAAFHAGAQAAADIVIALYERARSGLGQHLDVSMQAAVVWTLMNATGYPPVTGHDPPGTCAERAAPRPEIVPGLRVPRFFECGDGHAFAALGVGRIGQRASGALMRWTDTAGFLPEDLCGQDFSRWIAQLVEGTRTIDEMERAFDALAAHLRTRSKRELMRFAVENDVLLAPVYDLADMRSDSQLAARDYWVDVGRRIHPGPFARLSETPIALRSPAPELGDALEEVSGDLAPARQQGRAELRSASAHRDGAFDGVKVADFAWVGVGPIISKALADHGATVVHVESEGRLDILRQLPPFKDDEPGTQRSQFHANFNTSKLGLGLDLSTAGGLELARRLADWADVVVESFSPGTMKKLGLDWETLGAGRPELVMLSTCLRGQTGPERSYSGFGGQGAALAGFYSITGWPDRPPCGPWGAYTDFIAPRYGVAALGAALFHRARTGRGQHIDLSQVEAAIHFLEPLALDYTVNGRTPRPIGLDSPSACPHGVYATAGNERYIAIAVENAAHWEALCSVAPLAGLLDEKLGELSARIEHRSEIDAWLSAVCCDADAFELALRLQAAGVPAYAVLRPSDLYDDPQLLHREFFVTLEHGEMGPTPYDGLVTRFSRTPGRLRAPGPLLGEHTDRVLREILGLGDDEITAYAVEGALT